MEDLLLSKSTVMLGLWLVSPSKGGIILESACMAVADLRSTEMLRSPSTATCLCRRLHPALCPSIRPWDRRFGARDWVSLKTVGIGGTSFLIFCNNGQWPLSGIYKHNIQPVTIYMEFRPSTDLISEPK